MAKADKRSERIVTVIETVNLTLSIHEAEALRAVLDHVAGSTDSSPRKHIGAITSALASAGVRISPGAPWDAVRTRRHPASLIDRSYIGIGVQFLPYPSTWEDDDRG